MSRRLDEASVAGLAAAARLDGGAALDDRRALGHDEDRSSVPIQPGVGGGDAFRPDQDVRGRLHRHNAAGTRGAIGVDRAGVDDVRGLHLDVAADFTGCVDDAGVLDRALRKPFRGIFRSGVLAGGDVSASGFARILRRSADHDADRGAVRLADELDAVARAGGENHVPGADRSRVVHDGADQVGVLAGADRGAALDGDRPATA